MGIKKDKLTDDQKLEIERLRSFVSRNRLTARMNGTKWRAAIDAVTALAGYVPSFRVKLVTDREDPPAGAWETDFPGRIPLYNSIEWLELHPHGQAAAGAARPKRPPDFRETLKRDLGAAGIPLAESPTGVRIIGYSRN